MFKIDKYLKETKLLNYSHPTIQTIIEYLHVRELQEKEKIIVLYNFIRDDIAFGYNIDDVLSASTILADGYGQCNTKGILFMTLLRAVDIPCRIHGFTIDKKLQKGAMTGMVYKSAPQMIIHSWVEVYFNNKWFNLEGFILDMNYLKALQEKKSDCIGTFCGYGVATKDFQNPPVDWNENDTYIQKEGIVQDFGIYDTPDEFFKEHSQRLSPIKQCLYRHYGRHRMNQNVKKIRKR